VGILFCFDFLFDGIIRYSEVRVYIFSILMTGKILIKLVGLIIVIGILNLLYSNSYYKRDLNEKYPEAVTIRNTQANTDIYYFGESSNVTYHPEDSLKASISELTGMFFPGLTITTINKYATHAGIYKEWIKELKMPGEKPKALIVTLNLRSFDAAWINSKLETPLRESLVLAKPYPPLFNRFLLSLQAFDNKSEQQREIEMQKKWQTDPLYFPFPFKYKTVSEWDQAMANGSYLNADGSWDMKKIELACHYIKAYAFNLNDQNPRVRDFDEIKKWCMNNNVALFLNLMAENIGYADSLVGKELVFLMKQNRKYLIDRYQGNNCRVVDNLEVVSGEQFIDQEWTSEHYRYKGRMAIAKNLADSLKTIYLNDYKKVY
jgi:hypothetical protein